MTPYNSLKDPIRLPEYGRYVQSLVDKCLTIEDRAERCAYARGIVYTIYNLFPQQKNSPEWRAKVWEHLAIMADFKLDVDFPSEISKPEELARHPGTVPLPGHRITMRQYGHNVEQMIATACSLDDDNPDRQELGLLIANHMKKLLLQSDPDLATDRRIFKDLAILSDGQLVFNAEDTPLQHFNIIAPATTGKKKKKKR